MPRFGSGDSAVAIVTISVPMKENIVTRRSAMTAPKPLGMKPSGSHRWCRPLTPESGISPQMARIPTMMNATMARTLIEREPELELAVVADADEVGDRECGRHGQCPDPLGPTDQIGEDRGRRRRLHRDDEHPEPPVQPADGEAGPPPERAVGVDGERAGVGVGGRHLPQHPHDQHHESARHRVGDEDGRTGLLDRVRRSDEQARADDPGDRDHGDVPGLEARPEAIRGLRRIAPS